MIEYVFAIWVGIGSYGAGQWLENYVPTDRESCARHLVQYERLVKMPLPKGSSITQDRVPSVRMSCYPYGVRRFEESK